MKAKLALLVVVATAAATAAGVAATDAKARIATGCTPNAYVPIVSGSGSNRTSFADGYTSGCTAGQGWAYTIRLANASGGSLVEISSNSSGNAYVNTYSVPCNGNSVHAFFYINVGGTGKSDTSGNANPNCN